MNYRSLGAFLLALAAMMPSAEASGIAMDWTADPVRQAKTQLLSPVPAVPSAVALRNSEAPPQAAWPLSQQVIPLVVASLGIHTSREAALADAQAKLQIQLSQYGGAGTFGIGSRLEGAWEVKNLAPSGPVSMQIDESSPCPSCRTYYVAQLAQTIYWERYICKDLQYLPDGRRQANCPSGVHVFWVE